MVRGLTRPRWGHGPPSFATRAEAVSLSTSLSLIRGIDERGTPRDNPQIQHKTEQ